MDPQAALLQRMSSRLRATTSLARRPQVAINRNIAQSHIGFPVDGFQKRCYGFPREGAGQLFKPVKAGSIDLAIQSGTHSAMCREKPK